MVTSHALAQCYLNELIMSIISPILCLPIDEKIFISAHIPLYLYPFLNTTSKTRPFEYLRLTSLGVIGALVKVICAWKFT